MSLYVESYRYGQILFELLMEMVREIMLIVSLVFEFSCKGNREIIGFGHGKYRIPNLVICGASIIPMLD